ncbi:MAG TPA: transglutaminase-like domain-containing protein [Roseimicrobium sp.]|nr:transglutaminase-like domain-containing protein [Roseimicrobium sp.]
MKKSSTKLTEVALSESQRQAMLGLLSDEDPVVYDVVRKRLLREGMTARDWLNPMRLSEDPVVRSRVQEILHIFDRQASDGEFVMFCLKSGEEFDLERGAWMLARTRYPDVNMAAYQAVLDTYAGELMERIDFGSAPGEILECISDYVFQQLGFKGDDSNYYDPRNSYLNQVVDRRCGNPISLCQIYLFLARRLRLPLVGIGMPGHFICRFQSSTDEIFVDVFNEGRLITKADCMRYLQQTGHEASDRYLIPSTPKRTLLRVCSNLHQIYLNQNGTVEASRLERYIVALSKQPLSAIGS